MAGIDISSLLRREAEDLLSEIEDDLREGAFKMAGLNKEEQAFMEEAERLKDLLIKIQGDK